MWLIHGHEKIVKKEIEIIARAKSSIFIIVGFMFDNEAYELKKSLNKAIKRGVHVKIVLSSLFNPDDGIDVFKEISGLNCEIKKNSCAFN